jgi:hypothetical protein
MLAQAMRDSTRSGSVRLSWGRQQREYVERMDLGPGIAPNEALLENTFVLLVCMVLKIPVFLVGGPGSSKTLAMKRIESNLRGLDSRDPAWRRLGEVKVVSYQGSESSTSEGVQQAYEKANEYAKSNGDRSIVALLIDEVSATSAAAWLRVIQTEPTSVRLRIGGPGGDLKRQSAQGATLAAGGDRV